MKPMNVVAEFSLDMIGKPVEIGVYRIDGDKWVASYGGRLEAYVCYVGEVRWSMLTTHETSRISNHSLTFADSYYYLVSVLED